MSISSPVDGIYSGSGSCASRTLPPFPCRRPVPLRHVVGFPHPRLLTKPMVLVCYIPNKDISILQTKFSDRERHEARRVGLEAMPLDEHIEGRHSERQARLKIGPAPMHHLQIG